MARLSLTAALTAFFLLAGCSAQPPEPQPTEEPRKITIFLDAGHGKSSGAMSEEEKAEYGWVRNAGGAWGEWRHWREGQYGDDCEGNDGDAQSQPSSCWYPIGNSDRAVEPDINLQNCLSAKVSLEQMGYRVILSRETNDENPSITRRIEKAVSANADLYICVHSNAGGGSGTAYIAMSEDDNYYALRRGDNGEFSKNCNLLSKTINDKIAERTSLNLHGSGCIGFEPYLILFQKSPIPAAYLEIGFFDNEHDLEIIKNEHDKIGLAIAEGVQKHLETRPLEK